MPKTRAASRRHAEFEIRLTRALGPIVAGTALSRALGYPSQAAFRQAAYRERLPIPVFKIEGRRGYFALTADIATWLFKHQKRSPAKAD